jgi:hypothetical protein
VFDSRQRQENFFVLRNDPALGPTQPPIQWVLGVSSPMLKRLRRDRSPPSTRHSLQISLHGFVFN